MSAENTPDTPDGPDTSDASTRESILAATPEGNTAEAAEFAVAAAESDMGPGAMGAMLIALGGSISDEDDLVVLLQRVVDVAHEAIDGADSAGITIHLGGLTYTAVHTDSRTLRVDTDQYEAGDGPCLHAARTGETVLVDVDASEQRWPPFAANAAEEGIHSFLAAALSAADQPLGALNLYGKSGAAFDSVDADVLEMLTTTVSRAIGDYARFKSAEEVATALRTALENRAPIEQAKGILMARHSVDADTAFHLLRKQSQTTNRRLRDIAVELTESAAG